MAGLWRFQFFRSCGLLGRLPGFCALRWAERELPRPGGTAEGKEPIESVLGCIEFRD